MVLGGLGKSTYEQDAQALRPLLMERSRLTRSTAASATTIYVNSLPRGAGSYSGYLAIDPYTTECEVRRYTRTGKICTVAALAYAHGQYDEVLFIDDLPYISAKWFGALGDGTTDDSTAIARAITQADALYANVMLLPEKYNLGSTGLTLTENTGLIGGRWAIASNEGTWLTYSGSGNAITINGQVTGFDSRRGIFIRDLTIECTHASASIGIRSDFNTLYTIDRVYATGAKTAGFYFENSYNGIIRQCRADTCVIGLHFKVKNDAGDNVFSGQTLIEQCDFWQNTDSGIKLEQPYNTLAQLEFNRCHCKSNGYGAYIVEAHKSMFLGCHFETNTTNGVYTHADVDHGPIISGCFFNHSSDTYAIDDNGDGTIIENCEFYTSGSPATGKGISVGGAATVIRNNTFRSMASSIVLESTASDVVLGINRWVSESGNKVTDSGATDVVWEGEIILKSPVLDLSGSAVTHFAMVADRDLWLREAKIIYTEASSADAGVVIGAGISSDTTKLFDYTTETSQSQWTVAVPSYDSYFIDTDQVIVFRSAGGKTGGGECVIELYLLPYPMA